MASHLRSLFERIFPSGKGAQRVIIAGLDCTGKTTLLYLLKLGYVVETCPTIGFNVETTPVATSSGRNLQIEGWDVGFGCASIQIAMRMLASYTPHTKAFIWMVDSTDKERLAESAELLRALLLETDADLEKSEKGRHIPVLILANKSDKGNALSLDDVRKVFAPATTGRLVSVHQTSLVQRPALGLLEAFEWLSIALDIAATTTKGTSTAVIASNSIPDQVPNRNSRDPEVLSARLRSWLERTGEDLPGDEFIAQFNLLNLPSWDHYTHIRIAYLLLVGHGRQKGKDLIFKGLADYIANSSNSQTNTRAFHLTMTYFWIQLVHLGIRNMPPQAVESEAKEIGTVYPSSADFFRFLVINHYLVDGSLWSDFYSKEVLMTQEAKETMVLPDKKPLPNLVIRDTISGLKS